MFAQREFKQLGADASESVTLGDHNVCDMARVDSVQKRTQLTLAVVVIESERDFLFLFGVEDNCDWRVLFLRVGDAGVHFVASFPTDDKRLTHDAILRHGFFHTGAVHATCQSVQCTTGVGSADMSRIIKTQKRCLFI